MVSLITFVPLLLLRLVSTAAIIHSGENRLWTLLPHTNHAVSLVDGQGGVADETEAGNMYQESYITAEAPLKLH